MELGAYRQAGTTRERAETARNILAAVKAIGLNTGEVKMRGHPLSKGISAEDKKAPHELYDYNSPWSAKNAVATNFKVLKNCIESFRRQDKALEKKGEQTMREENPRLDSYIKAIAALATVYDTSATQLCSMGSSMDYNQDITKQARATMKVITQNCWKALQRTIKSESGKGGLLKPVGLTKAFRDGKTEDPDGEDPKADVSTVDLSDPNQSFFDS